MKCIIIETSPERPNAKPVTNENGTPHIYATIKEARAELRANGYSYNRANDRYYFADAPEYRAYIIHEDSEEYQYTLSANADQLKDVDEYAKSAESLASDAYWAGVKMRDAKTAEEIDHLLKFATISAELAEEAAIYAAASLDYAINHVYTDYCTSPYAALAVEIRREEARDAKESARRAERSARHAKKAAAEAREHIAAQAIQEAQEAMEEAERHESAAIMAALEYDASAAADHAEKAEEAADRAEEAAQAAQDAATTPEACSMADAASEYAAAARDASNRASETAAANAIELEERAAIIERIEDAALREYIRTTAEAHQWSPEETRDNVRFYERIHAANAAAVSLLDAYAEAIGEYPAEEDPETVAAYRAAHDEIIGNTHRATAADRATVESMINAIAEHHLTTA